LDNSVTDTLSFEDRPFTRDPGSEHGNRDECASSSASRLERDSAAELLARFADACPPRHRSTRSTWHALLDGDDAD
jgi:hypothetical protein